MKKLIIYILVTSLLFSALVLFCSADGVSVNDTDLAIVFTHDLHSHIDSFELDGNDIGGFARIKAFIDDTKSSYENTLVFDAGDFSMGTLFQTAFTSSAVEYRMLGELGFDATTFGNHEFDYGFDAVRTMISTAKSNSLNLPPILCANLNVSESGLSDNELAVMNINEYKILHKGDYTIAVFGILGRDAVELSSASGLVFDDFIDAAKHTVAEIESLYSPDVIVCLSHSGTGSDVNDEDIELAKEVSGIDVIISGHTHTYLGEPIIVNDTIIASCGEYGENVGKIVLDVKADGASLISYKLTEMNDSVPADPYILDTIDAYREAIIEYLSEFGYESGDQIIAYSPFDFPEQSSMSENLSEQPLGNLISDSYIHDIKQSEGNEYINVDVAVVPVGVIRASIDKGYLSVSEIYEISSLGIGDDGVSGYPLCSVYLYGSELWALAEIDASVSGIMSYAQLYCSGLGYSVNTNRMFMNRVYDCWLTDDEGNRIEIVDDKLYRVVSGITSAEMLGTVKGKSFGLLELTPKDRFGNEITDFSKYIATDSNGSEIKEWKALADYLGSFPKGDDGVSVIPEKYFYTMGRKNIYDGFSAKQLFSNWNLISWIILFIILLFISVVSIIVVLIIRKIKRKNRMKFALRMENEIHD